MYSIAAVIVLFNPQDNVVDNIRSYSNEIQKLYIICNSDISNHIINAIQLMPHVNLLHQGSNIGIAKSLNQAISQAQQDNMQWLLTMDQDTFFHRGDFKQFITDCQLNVTDDVLLFSPLHNSRHIQNSADTLFEQKDLLMTSANLVNVAKARLMGGYDENLFIDDVDHEFCFRAAEHQFKIVQHTQIAVSHQLGTQHTKLKHIRLYPPQRLYYMLRNYLYIEKKYRSTQTEFFNNRRRYFKRFFFNQFIYGSSRFEIIRMLFKAHSDYKNNKLGKVEF